MMTLAGMDNAARGETDRDIERAVTQEI